MTESNEWLFVSWIGYHGRSDDLAAQLPAREEYVTGGEGNRLVRYVRQWVETRRLVKQTRPSAIFVMQPPVLALWSVLSAAPNETFIVGDLHTGVFTDRKWSWAARGLLRSLRRRQGAVIVTNESLADRCRTIGTTTFVLDDAVPRRVGTAPASPESTNLSDLTVDEYVLVPLAYASDEPLDEILAAAAEDSTRAWVLTGRAPEAVRRAASPNVRFSGFVSNDDYNWLAANAGVVLACTDEEDTMQRAGYEAVSWERPLVTSRMRVLKDYFGDAAEFADPTSASILLAIQRAVSDREGLISRIAALGERKREEHALGLAKVRDFTAGRER
ncbi:hypothetical protein [Microbacterium karelineae]|uniref:hypothetical protein n=1 Tax=Microbacterium karelineae TaxID=2654283 RepID=UPI0012EAB0D6|nr:hypothetical protein [Microbacterium karelineae]